MGSLLGAILQPGTRHLDFTRQDLVATIDAMTMGGASAPPIVLSRLRLTRLLYALEERGGEFQLIGLFAIAVGLLWMGQGAGFVRWPESSFMIRQFQWVYYGAATTVAGIVVLLVAHFRRG